MEKCEYCGIKCSTNLNDFSNSTILKGYKGDYGIFCEKHARRDDRDRQCVKCQEIRVEYLMLWKNKNGITQVAPTNVDGNWICYKCESEITWSDWSLFERQLEEDRKGPFINAKQFLQELDSI